MLPPGPGLSTGTGTGPEREPERSAVWTREEQGRPRAHLAGQRPHSCSISRALGLLLRLETPVGSSRLSGPDHQLVNAEPAPPRAGGRGRGPAPVGAKAKKGK